MVVPSTAAARCGPSASAASSGRSRRCTGPRPTAAARTTAATPSGWHACWRAATSSRCGSPTSALEDARDDLQHAKQRMSKFLLRHGLVFDETTPAGRRRGAWTGAYWDWTESLSFDEPDDAAAYEHYMDGNDLVENTSHRLRRRGRRRTRRARAASRATRRSTVSTAFPCASRCRAREPAARSART